MAVTLPAPKRRVNRALCKLDTTVPTAMIMDTMPAYDSGTPNSGCIVGQAAPSSASGNPRLINAR